MSTTRYYEPSPSGTVTLWRGGVGWVEVDQREYLRSVDPDAAWLPVTATEQQEVAA